MKFMSLGLRKKLMIFFRLLAVVIGLYIVYLVSFRLGVGMVPIWLALFGLSLGLSFEPIYIFIFEHKFLKVIVIVSLLFFIMVELFICYAGVKTNINEDSDYIIVLGASVKGQTPSLTLRRRILKAKEYLDLHPDTIAILSGGQGPGENITEAQAMKRALVNDGITENRLLLEEQSTSTMENIKYSYEIINSRSSETEVKVIVISSRFHLLRSQLIAKKQGFSIKAIGSSTLIYLVPNYYLREFFGLFYELIR